MSLINDALIDLEKRASEYDKRSIPDDTFPGSTENEPRLLSGKTRLILLSCVPGLVVFSLGFSVAKHYMGDVHQGDLQEPIAIQKTQTGGNSHNNASQNVQVMGLADDLSVRDDVTRSEVEQGASGMARSETVKSNDQITEHSASLGVNVLETDTSQNTLSADKTVEVNSGSQIKMAVSEQLVSEPVSEADSVDKQLGDLEQKFLLALQANHLSTPIANNAFYYLKKIKKLNSDYSKLDYYHNSILEKYFVLIDKSLKSGQYDDAEQYRTRLYAVAETSASQKTAITQRLSTLFSKYQQRDHKNTEQPKIAAQERAVLNSGSIASLPNTGTLAASTSAVFKMVERDSDTRNATASSTARSPQNKNLFIAPSGSYSQHALLADVENLLSHGDSVSAIKRLESAVIIVGADMELASNKLIELYISNTDYSSAQLEINRRGKLHSASIESSEELNFFQALVIKSTLGDEQAYAFLDLLETRGLRSETLYAGYLQKHNRLTDAVESYKGLIRIEPKNVRHWLGLAVSSDKVGDASAALQAYNTTKAIGGLSPSVSQFVDTRIAVLKANNSLAHNMELSQW